MKPSLALYRSFLAQYLGPHKWQVALLALLLCGQSALSVYEPQLLRMFIDSVVAGSEVSGLAFIALGYAAVALSIGLLRGVVGFLGVRISTLATNRLRTDMLRHAITLDMFFFSQHPPGTMLERIDGDANQLHHFFSEFSIRLFQSALLLIGVIVFLILEDWRICLAMSLFILAASLLMLKMRSFGVPYNEKLREASARLYGFVEERLSSLEDIKALGGMVYTLRRMVQLIDRQIHHGRRAYSLGNLMWPLNLVIMGTGAGLILGWGGYLALRGDMTFGTIYLLFSYMNLMFWPMEELSHQMEELQKAGGNLVRIQGLMNTRSSLEDGTRADLGQTPVGLEFRNVSFIYADDVNAVLDHVSFTVEPGRTLGILGRTGSGKTTVTRLLTRLYDPLEGSVRLNDVDLREFRLDTLRSRIGVVTQDVQFFSGTLRQNLTMFDASIADASIVDIIGQLGMDPWFHTLPEGLETKVTGSSLGLSAGEAQRLALARVFLRDPQVVILDEAAARLDPASEVELEAALRKLLRQRTSLVIAHRLKSVEKADDILILHEGQVQEYGTRRELQANPNSQFSQLLKLGLE